MNGARIGGLISSAIFIYILITIGAWIFALIGGVLIMIVLGIQSHINEKKRLKEEEEIRHEVRQKEIEEEKRILEEKGCIIYEKNLD